MTKEGRKDQSCTVPVNQLVMNNVKQSVLSSTALNCNSTVTRTRWSGSRWHGLLSKASLCTDHRVPYKLTVSSSRKYKELCSRGTGPIRSVPDFTQFPPILNHFLPLEFIFKTRTIKMQDFTDHFIKYLICATHSVTRAWASLWGEMQALLVKRGSTFIASLWNQRCGDPPPAEQWKAALWHP